MSAHLDVGIYGARGIPSTYSGYETFLTVLLPELVKRGHLVTIYCRTGQVDGEGDFKGVRKRFLPALDTKALNTLSHGAISALAARRAGHDVVLVVNVANALFCGISRWTGQSVVLNTDGQEWLRGKWGGVARRFFRLSARLSSKMATGLISDCVAMRDLYQRDFSAVSTVIPYCWTGLEPSPPTAFLAELRLEPGRFFCQAGRLNPENNAVLLAQAYAKSTTDWPLVILGEANYDSPVARDLQRLAAEDKRIRLIGHVGDRGDYASLVQHAGGYFHTHSVGGINPSLIEAMGLGAFVIALNTPFNAEALGTAGHCFAEFGDRLTQLVDAIPRMEPTDAQRLRAAASARVRSRYSTDAVVDAYEQLLVEAAATRRWGSSLVIDTPWPSPPGAKPGRES